MLCNQAKEKKTQYLYRKTIPNGSAKCPKFLTRWGVSYNISYSEVSIESSQFQEVENCGEPRSELNSCFRKQAQAKPSLKIRTANAISWIYLGDVA